MPGRGGRRDRPPPSRSVQVSKKLSWLLRHGATAENLALREGGYALVSDVLANRNIRSLKVTFEELAQLVRDNDKQRFALHPVPDDESASLSNDPQKWVIRANQGHSLALEGGTGGLLTPISRDNLPAMAVHGTTHSAWPQIVASGGLKPMGRIHVHFASGLPAGFRSIRDADGTAAAVDRPVISGMRNSSTILVFLDLPKAMDAGLKFGMSENGVILTEGDGEGLVSFQYFNLVEDRTGQGVLVENGQVVKDAPAAWASKGKGKLARQT